MKHITISTILALFLSHYCFANYTFEHQEAELKNTNKKFKNHKKKVNEYKNFIKDSLGLSNVQQQKLDNYTDNVELKELNNKMEKMTSALNLTEQQASQIKGALTEHAVETKKIKTDNSLSKALKAEAFSQLKDKMPNLIMHYLNPEQQSKFNMIKQALQQGKNLKDMMNLIPQGTNSLTEPILKEAAKSAIQEGVKGALQKPDKETQSEIKNQTDNLNSLY